MASEQNILTNLAEERLRLEREKLEIERSRLETAKVALHNNVGMVNSPGRIWAMVGGVAVLVVIAFACGVLFGSAMSRSQDEAIRERRLAQTLARIGAFTFGSTNTINDLRRDVSVLVIQ